jgi:hypothetical protein
MLDDLRNSAIQSFPEDEEPPGGGYEPPSRQRRTQSRLLGMTAVQRFILAIMLFMMTCILGVLCLVMTGRVWI